MTEGVPEGYKRCSKCGEVKPVEEFYKNNTIRGGVCSQCKECMQEYKKKYYGKNRETLLDGMKKYHEKNRETLLDGMKKYYGCVKKPTCPAVGGYGAKFVVLTCPICGKEFRMLKKRVDYLYDTRGQTLFYCSKACFYESKRKARQTEYEKNIKRIRKEQRL